MLMRLVYLNFLPPLNAGYKIYELFNYFNIKQGTVNIRLPVEQLLVTPIISGDFRQIRALSSSLILCAQRYTYLTIGTSNYRRICLDPSPVPR